MKECASTLFGPFICGDSMSFNANHLLTGSWRQKNSLQIWDWRKPGLLRNLELSNGTENSCSVYAAKYLGKNYIGAGGNGPNPCFSILDEVGYYTVATPAELYSSGL